MPVKTVTDIRPQESGEGPEMHTAKMLLAMIGEKGAYATVGVTLNADTYDHIYCLQAGDFTLTGGNWSSDSVARATMSMAKGQIIPVFGATAIVCNTGALIAKARS